MEILADFHCVKSVQIRSFCSSVFGYFSCSVSFYGVNFRIQSEYTKIRTRKNFVFGQILRSVSFLDIKICRKNGKLITCAYGKATFSRVFTNY